MRGGDDVPVMSVCRCIGGANSLEEKYPILVMDMRSDPAARRIEITDVDGQLAIGWSPLITPVGWITVCNCVPEGRSRSVVPSVPATTTSAPSISEGTFSGALGCAYAIWHDVISAAAVRRRGIAFM